MVKTALALVALIIAGPAVASDMFECRFPLKAKNGGWIPEIVAVIPQPGSQEVLVFDPVINNFIGDPIEAKITTDNGSRTTYSWSYRAGVKGQVASMDYRLTIQKADLSASITAQARGYIGPYQANGSCTRKKA